MKKELVMLAAIASIIMVSATVSAQVYPEGMVSYWKFDEGSGITAFDSVGTNDGTLANGPVWTTGIVDGALSFDGLDDMIVVPHSSSLSLEKFTIEAWIKRYQNREFGEPILVKRYETSWMDNYGMYISPDGIVGASCYSPDIWSWFGVGSRRNISAGEWYHIAATYNRTAFKIYINGELDNSVSIQYRPYQNNYPLVIGRATVGDPCLFRPEAPSFYGIIDEIAIYNRALSAEEIQQHYQNGLNGLGYEELVVPATIDIDPDTLNLQSKGRWITAYIELPDEYDVSNIDVSTILLANTVSAEANPTEIGDYNEDGIPDLMVKFDRSAVQDILEVGDEVEITVTGEVAGTPFEGSDTIRVIDKGKGK